LKKFILLLTLPILLPSLCFAPPKPLDRYSVFLNTGFRYAKLWRPDIPVKEFNRYAWSVWDGCQGLENVAERYLAISIQENGMNCIDNEWGYGYSGARWWTIIKTLKNQGIKKPKVGWKKWIRTHRFVVNFYMANHFLSFVQDATLERATMTWHVGGDWQFDKVQCKRAWNYLRNVNNILKYYQTEKGIR